MATAVRALKFKTLKELNAECAAKPKPTQWGPWTYDAKANTLDHGSYFISLDDCQSSHEINDWLRHLSLKSWGTPYCLGHLHRAFRDLLDLEAMVASERTAMREVSPGRVED